MKSRELHSVEYLKECFELDADCPSGLRWKFRPVEHFKSEHSQKRMNSTYAGKPAGNLGEDDRYMTVGVGMKVYMSHRVVYAIHNNDNNLDGLKIDHINRNHFDNSPENLRIITHVNNCQNSNLSKNNTSGHKHVYINNGKKGPTWTVCIKTPERYYWSGTFKDFKEACDAAKKSSIEVFGVFSPFYNEPKEDPSPYLNLMCRFMNCV